MILKYGSSSNSKQAVRALSLVMGLGAKEKYTRELKALVTAFSFLGAAAKYKSASAAKKI